MSPAATVCDAVHTVHPIHPCFIVGLLRSATSEGGRYDVQ